MNEKLREKRIKELEKGIETFDMQYNDVCNDLLLCVRSKNKLKKKIERLEKLINTPKHETIINIDELYKLWSGESHLEKSGIDSYDSSQVQDFGEYCIGEYKRWLSNHGKPEIEVG